MRFNFVALFENRLSVKTCCQEIGAKYPALHLSTKQAGSDSRLKGIVVALEAPKDEKVGSLDQCFFPIPHAGTARRRSLRSLKSNLASGRFLSC